MTLAMNEIERVSLLSETEFEAEALPLFSNITKAPTRTKREDATNAFNAFCGLWSIGIPKRQRHINEWLSRMLEQTYAS